MLEAFGWVLLAFVAGVLFVLLKAIGRDLSWREGCHRKSGAGPKPPMKSQRNLYDAHTSG